MVDDLVHFGWEVPQDGFKWMPTRSIEEHYPRSEMERQVAENRIAGTSEWFLTPVRPWGRAGTRIRSYAPLDDYTGLFRSFAGTELTREGILAFANEYGLLGGDVSNVVHLPHSLDPDSTTMGPGEAFGRWVQEITAMRHALTLWDLVQAEDVAALAKHIRWVRPDTLDYFVEPISEGNLTPYEGGWDLIAAPHYRPELLERFRPGEIVTPALYQVQQVVNKHLEGRVSPRMLWDRNRTRLGLHMVPTGLIGALWLQFSQAVTGRRQYRQCRQCGRWFELHPDTARTNKAFCSNACRSKAYRMRQAEARRLAAEGVVLAEIAQRLDTDDTTVQGWLQ